MTVIVPGKPLPPIVVDVESGSSVGVSAGRPTPPTVITSQAGAEITVRQGIVGPEGPEGPQGTPGADGPAGPGVPAGGTTGQLLRKASGANYDTEWATGSGGAGVADSFETVNKNLAASNATIAYSGGELASITYANGIIKALGYGPNGLATVTLSGSTPGGISLTKTLQYTLGELTGFTYS